MSKIILVAATSINSKITHGLNGDSFSWTSSEDQQYFSTLVKKSDLVIMGRKTYSINSSKMDLNHGPSRLILTKHPQNYSHLSIPHKLEFTSLSPKEIINTYSPKYNQILVLGGGEINSLFLSNNLIDEIFLTIEPLIFGKGKNLFTKLNIDQKCSLISVEKLNSTGTLLLKYKITHTCKNTL